MKIDDVQLELLQQRFLEFVNENIEILQELYPDITEKQAGKIVVNNIFELLLRVWKKAHGSKYMAEYFYQIADKFVDASNGENEK